MRLSVVRKVIKKCRSDLKSEFKPVDDDCVNYHAREWGCDSVRAAYRLGYGHGLSSLSFRAMNELSRREAEERINSVARELVEMPSGDFSKVMRRVYGSH